MSPFSLLHHHPPQPPPPPRPRHLYLICFSSVDGDFLTSSFFQFSLPCLLFLPCFPQSIDEQKCSLALSVFQSLIFANFSTQFLTIFLQFFAPFISLSSSKYFPFFALPFQRFVFNFLYPLFSHSIFLFPVFSPIFFNFPIPHFSLFFFSFPPQSQINLFYL